MADTISRAAHSNICTVEGITGETIQIASPRSITPNRLLIVCIHGPALGSSVPADRPTASSGTPMPRARANSAVPPKKASRVWLMYNSAPANGAATHGPTIKADSTPMVKTPHNVPPPTLLLVSANLLWNAAGNCNSYRPNMESESPMNRAANAASTHGFWRAFDNSVPDRPAPTRASA